MNHARPIYLGFRVRWIENQPVDIHALSIVVDFFELSTLLVRFECANWIPGTAGAHDVSPSLLGCSVQALLGLADFSFLSFLMNNRLLLPTEVLLWLDESVQNIVDRLRLFFLAFLLLFRVGHRRASSVTLFGQFMLHILG